MEGAKKFKVMDICMINVDNRLNKSISPTSVHGMLWLQTHFDNDQWEAISENRVLLSDSDAKLLIEDADLAGVKIESISEISILDVFPKTN